MKKFEERNVLVLNDGHTLLKLDRIQSDLWRLSIGEGEQSGGSYFQLDEEDLKQLLVEAGNDYARTN